MRAKADPTLRKWINKTYDRHITPHAQNKMLKLLASKLLCKIATDIRSSGCYSILADEATYVSNTQQLVTCIRWATEGLLVKEDSIGLMPLNKESAAAIKYVIIRMGLSIVDAKAQCYNGCFTMTGV